jgi:hypothetical protein
MNRFLLTLGATWPLLALHQGDSAPCVAHLALSQEGEIMHVTGSCRSQLSQPARYHYELRTLRQGPAGESRTTQRGTFELPAQQQVQLSQVGLSAEPSSHYRIHLLVSDDAGRTISQDSTSH